MNCTTPSTTMVPFDYIRRYAFSWRRVHDGYKINFVDNPQWGVRAAELVLNDNQLLELHPQLPMLVQALSTQFDSYIPAGAVDCTLHHYESPLYLPDGRGSSRVVRGIHAVTPSDHNMFIGLSVETYDLYTIDMNGQAITVAGSGYNTTFLLSFAEFNAIFPGWETRYAVAKELGYLGQQLADIVCAEKPKFASADVSTILFE